MIRSSFTRTIGLARCAWRRARRVVARPWSASVPAAILFGVGFSSVDVHADVIPVSPATDLQAAIDAAATGDTLLFAPGDYVAGDLVVGARQSLTLEAQDPGNRPRFTATPGAKRLIGVESTGGSILRNLEFAGDNATVSIGGEGNAIEGCAFDGTNSASFFASGLEIRSAVNTTVDACQFVNAFGVGAAMLGVAQSDNTMINNSTFSMINGRNGMTILSTTSNTLVTGCVFISVSTPGLTGAVVIEAGATDAVIDMTTFTLCGGTRGAAISIFEGGSGTVTDCNFLSNIAGDAGAAVWIEEPMYEDPGVVALSGNSFCANQPANTRGDFDNEGANTVCGCLADFDESGVVGFPDLVLVLSAFGDDRPFLDLNGSGVIDFPDIVQVIGVWGPCS